MAHSPLAAAGSPQPLAPAPVAVHPKPLLVEAVSSPRYDPGTPTSVTSKVWIVPPRPKPGRKPATDTPPTKRKAQNRAAQRAFRERRAAKIGELEDHIEDIKSKHNHEKLDLEAKIAQLNNQAHRLRDEIAFWQQRCRALGTNVEEEFKWRDMWISGQYVSTSTPPGSSGNDAPLPLKRSKKKSNSSTPQIVQVDTQLSTGAMTVAMGCGKCTTTSRCQCIDEAFNLSSITTDLDDAPSTSPPAKRPHSPLQATSTKRKKQTPSESPVDCASPLETDFTTAFSSLPAQPDISTSINSAIPQPMDPCGFCEPGSTVCFCAEMSVSSQSQSQSADQEQQQPQQRSRSRLSHLSQFTPPPSDSDVTHAPGETQQRTQCCGNGSCKSVAALEGESITNPCINGPGTCAACLADPNRTLFCKTLCASSSSTSNKLGSGSRSNSTCNNSQPTLNCLDTYTTLSRHPHFYEATDEMGTWVPKLGATRSSIKDRPRVEIEVANVMQTLKYFDRRWGRQ